MSDKLKFLVPPIRVFILGYPCDILEVSRHDWIDGKTHYIVTVRCFENRVFDLDVTSNEELIRKLEVEVSKYLLVSGKIA